MPSRRWAREPLSIALFLVGSALASAPRDAFGGEKEDNAANAGVERILRTDVAQANFGEGKRKLRALLDKCKKGCSPATMSRIHVGLGLISAELGRAEEAKASWNDALNADPNATLPPDTRPAVQQLFAEAQKAWLTANPQPDEAEKAGWVNKQAFELSKAAVAAAADGNYALCVEKGKAALTFEENMRARLHLAACEANMGKIVDALRDNAKVLEAARTKGDSATAKIVKERVTELVPKLAHVKFEPPKDVTDLSVTFDEKAVPRERMGDSFTIDPGKHTVHAEGILRGVRVTMDDQVEVGEGATSVVKLALRPAALTQGQLECMVAAKTQADIAACLPQDRKTLVVRAGLDMSGYTDTTSVHVLTPSVRGSVASPTGGWDASASYLVDVVTAASPDVVATASPRFRDIRHAVTAAGGYKPGRFGARLYGGYSEERDYISRTIGGNVSGDFVDKQLVPSAGYAYTWDTIGRTGTPYDVYSQSLAIHDITAGATVIVSPTSLFVFGGGVALEDGNQSKPYRFIPVFEPGVSVPIGGSVDEVNRNRLPFKPLEQLPLDRQRYTVSLRYVARVGGSATLRLEERLYNDSWNMRATTTDARYLVDVGKHLRIWPHAHVHAQTATEFYRRIYGATLNSDGSATVPQFRTSDRELSPMLGFTLGGGVRYAVTESPQFELAFVLTADALYNHYFNSLYIQNRLAGYGTLGVEATFE